jgi:hypothetical protein
MQSEMAPLACAGSRKEGEAGQADVDVVQFFPQGETSAVVFVWAAGVWAAGDVQVAQTPCFPANLQLGEGVEFWSC